MSTYQNINFMFGVHYPSGAIRLLIVVVCNIETLSTLYIMSMSPHSGGCFSVTRCFEYRDRETDKGLLVFRALTRRVHSFSLTLKGGSFRQVRIFNCMWTNWWSATAIMRHSRAQSVTGRWDETWCTCCGNISNFLNSQPQQKPLRVIARFWVTRVTSE